MKTKKLLYFFLYAILGLISCQPQKNQELPTNEVEIRDTAVMDQIFEENCSGCHGGQMQAFVDREWKFGSSRDSLFSSIKNGRSAVGMPAWSVKFQDSVVNQLVNYITNGIDNVDKYKFDQIVASDTFQTEDYTIKLDTIASDISQAWGIAFLPDQSMIITDRNGPVYLIGKDKKKILITGTPEVHAQGQGGMLDITIDPDFKNNQLIYLSYSKPGTLDGEKASTTAVSRGKLVNGKFENSQIIFEALPYSKTEHHYGSRLTFLDGYLFITVGERGDRDNNPQDLTRGLGKVHRIYPDGTIPKDNPFVSNPAAVPSTYSYGHRNPQGMTSFNGQIWINEHGPRGGDEINIIQPRLNYGWPIISYGINYDGTTFTQLLEKEGMEQPLHYWVPSIAPSGMLFVAGDKYPAWKGSLLVGSLRFKYLNRCIIENGKVIREEKMLPNVGRLRSIAQDAEGYLYIGVDNPGYVFKLIPIKK